MKFRYGVFIGMVLFGLHAGPLMAQLEVFACEPEWAALSEELGGERISVYTATTALQDVHYIEARPSLIARLRRADLAVCTGAELEISWLPQLIRQAGNTKIGHGKPGLFEAALQVERLDVPQKVDRIMGDVHATGNPHVHLDPRRVLQIAKALSPRLQQLDPEGKTYYAARLAKFTQRWQTATDTWTRKASPLRGKRVVTHHKSWVYLFDWLGIEAAGTLEPKPGLPPSAGHLAELKHQLAATPAALIIRSAYQNPRAANWLSSQTGTPAVMLPYTVDGTPAADDLFGLFEDTLERMLATLR